MFGTSIFETSIYDRIKFIKAIHITPPRAHAATYAGGEDSAAVDAGSSISFVGNLTGQMKVNLLHILCAVDHTADEVMTLGRRDQLDPLRPACCQQQA